MYGDQSGEFGFGFWDLKGYYRGKVYSKYGEQIPGNS